MMALRLRGSEFMDQYFERTLESDSLIKETLDCL
jgi:hypothetical protein